MMIDFVRLFKTLEQPRGRVAGLEERSNPAFSHLHANWKILLSVESPIAIRPYIYMSELFLGTGYVFELIHFSSHRLNRDNCLLVLCIWVSVPYEICIPDVFMD